MLRVFLAVGLVVAIAISLTVVDRAGSTGDRHVDADAGARSGADPTSVTDPPTTDPTTSTTAVEIPTTSTVTSDPTPPPTGRAVEPTAPPTTRSGGPSFADERARAIAAGTPGASGTAVIASSCNGDGGRPHWGYFNNGAAGGTVFEPDGAVVPLGAVCLNPAQPDPYSSLVHELGHKWFWENGTWDASAATFGSTERAAECFARVFGATVFGAGGCPDSLVSVMAAILGR